MFQSFSKAFDSKKVCKYYLALLRGWCQNNDYHVKLAIGQDSREEVAKIKVATSNSEFCVKPKSAETLISVLSRGTFQGVFLVQNFHDIFTLTAEATAELSADATAVASRAISLISLLGAKNNGF